MAKIMATIVTVTGETYEGEIRVERPDGTVETDPVALQKDVSSITAQTQTTFSTGGGFLTIGNERVGTVTINARHAVSIALKIVEDQLPSSSDMV